MLSHAEFHKALLCMGPLLFNIYINDITQASIQFDFIMYVEDTALTSALENFVK